MLQVVARQMATQGRGGVIVQTGSVAGLRGTPTMSAYVASKAALHGLTMSAAKDLGSTNYITHLIFLNVLDFFVSCLSSDSAVEYSRQHGDARSYRP